MTEINKNNKEIGKTIATKVPINIHNQLINLIESGAYLSISDFLREAIREQLKSYKIAHFRQTNYFKAKKEVVSYFIKYDDCFLDEIAVDLELDFELVFNIVNDLILEGRVVAISDNELFERRSMKNDDFDYSKKRKNILKLDGKRLIIESRSKDYEFISIRDNSDYKTIFKNNGIVVDNATVILSEAYSFVK